MSNDIRWTQPVTSSPATPLKRVSQKQWAPYDDFIVDLRDRGLTVKDIQAALLNQKEFAVGYDALKKRLCVRKPINKTKKSTLKQLQSSAAVNSSQNLQDDSQLEGPPGQSVGDAMNIDEDAIVLAGQDYTQQQQAIVPHDANTFIEELVRDDNPEDEVETVLARIMFMIDCKDADDADANVILEVLGYQRNTTADDESIESVAQRISQSLAWS